MSNGVSLKGKRVLLAMQPKSSLSVGANGIQEGMIYHAQVLKELGAEVVVVSDLPIPGVQTILYSKTGDDKLDTEVAFKVRESRSMLDLAMELVKMHEATPFDIIQVKGHFHAARGLEVLKTAVGPDVQVVGSFHNFSDVGLSAIMSAPKIKRALAVGVQLDFLTEGSYKHWWEISINQLEAQGVPYEDSKKFLYGGIHHLLNPVIPITDLEGVKESLKSKTGNIAYIGRMTDSKGVTEIMRLAKETKIHVDFYGPLVDPKVEEWMKVNLVDNPYASYKGVLKQGEEATRTMMTYKALILLSRSVDISNRSMIKAAGLGIPTIIHGSGKGNKEVADMLTPWYQDFVVERVEGKKVMRFQDWVEPFRSACTNAVNLTDERRLELASVARDVFSIEAWKSKILDLYLSK